MVYFSLLSEALFGLTLIIVTGGTEHNLIAALPDDNGIDLRCESGYCVSALDGPKVKGQSWGFTSRSTARVILGQVLRIATCGTRTHRGDSL